MTRTVAEPKCQHSLRGGSVLVSSAADLVASAEAGERHASVRVCPREACIADAEDWLRVQGFDVFLRR